MKKRKGFTPLEKYCEGHYAQNADMCSFLKLPHKSKRKSLTGFTFIEVMIALILLMVGIVFLIDLFPLALKSFRNSKDVTISTFILQEKMEEIRNMPLGQAVPQGSFLDAANPQYRYNIISGDWAYNDDYEEISVKVGKDKGRMIGKVYAQASTTRPRTPKGDMATIMIPLPALPPISPTTVRHYVLMFITVPNKKEIYFAAGRALNTGQLQSPPSTWRPVPGLLPSDGEWIPDKISLGLNYVNNGTGSVDIDSGRVWVYVTDVKNKCVWGTIFNVVISPNPYAYLDLSFAGIHWTPIKNSLPEGY